MKIIKREDMVTGHEAEIVSLEAMVEKAFKEGFSDGLKYMGRDPTIPDVGDEWINRKWLESSSKRELYEEK